MRGKRKRRKFPRWLRAFVGLGLLVAVVGASFGAERGRRWLTAEGRFPIREVRVGGTCLLYEGEVLEMAGVERGTNLFALDTDAVEGRLEASGWLRRVSVSRRPPGRIDIQIDERRPWFLLASSEEAIFVDRSGRCFDTLGKEERLDLPLLVDETGDPGEAAARIARVFPESDRWFADHVAQVTVGADGSVTLIESGKGTVFRLGRDGLVERATRMRSVLRSWEQKGERFAELDLRYGSQAIARGPIGPS